MDIELKTMLNELEQEDNDQQWKELTEAYFVTI